MENSTTEAEKQAEIALKNAQTAKEMKQIEVFEPNKYKNEDAKILIEKISTVQNLIESWIFDGEKQVVGCDPVLKQTFTEAEIYTLKYNLFKLVEGL